MFSSFFFVFRREYSSRCWSALEVVKSVLVGYEVFPMVLGIGSRISGSDDVP